MKRVSKKDRRRLTVLVLFFIIFLTVFVSNMFSCWSQIYKNIKETKKLEEKYAEILDEEEMLKSEIRKLQDLDYVAKYAREKFLYSKDGEIIIKLD